MKYTSRKNIRLKTHNYSTMGYYFIAFCTKSRLYLLGNIENQKVVLNECGIIAERNMKCINEHIKCVNVKEYCIMPNHIHVILHIKSDRVGPPYMAALRERSMQTIPKAIQQYKASVSRDAGMPGMWQPKYYDHIIRSEDEYARISHYILSNPATWDTDEYYA